MLLAAMARSAPPTAARALAQAVQQRAASIASPKIYLGCAVYVSEGRDAAVIQHLEAVARSAPRVAALANSFVDEPYNRSNFTLVGTSVPQLAAVAAVLARAGLAAVDMRRHAAAHPRLGAVDHISCHPLLVLDGAAQATAAGEAAAAPEQQLDAAAAAAAATPAAQAAAASLARAIGQQLGSGPEAVPVLTYGWAHPQQRPLDELRRQLGYFREAAGGGWQGALQPPTAAAGGGRERGSGDQPLALPMAPCFGPPAAAARSGVCCIGAVPWLINYNVLLLTEDMPAARAVARAVSQRGGGLAGVQAMALRHTDGIEVACNLLDPAASPPAAVLAAVQRLAGTRGLQVGPAYCTNKTPQELVAEATAAGL